MAQQKYCTSCGETLPVDARFCASCGAPVNDAIREKAGARDKKRPASKPKRKRDLIVVAGVMALMTVAYFAFRSPAQPPEPPSGSETTSHGTMGGSGMDAAMPDMPSGYNQLVQMGNQYMDQQNFPVAAEAYRRALEQEGSDPNVRVDFGICLFRMGLAERAIDEFRNVIASNPNHALAYFNSGVVFYNNNQPDSAATYLRGYLQLAPDGPAAEAATSILNEISG